MKMKNKNLIYGLFSIGLVLILISSCKKEGNKETNIVTDIDGNVYHTVVIGNQTWMLENLKVIHYRNGDLIGTTSPATLDILSESNPKYQWAYNGNEDNADIYGRLYTWYAISDSRNICPVGWHIPSDEEWKELELQLGMSQADADGTDFRGTDEGCQLAGQDTLWNFGILIDNPRYALSGFTANPAGFHHPNGTFQHLGNYTHWWTSTEYDTYSAWYRELCINYTGIKRNSYGKTVAFSVRCIKD